MRKDHIILRKSIKPWFKKKKGRVGNFIISRARSSRYRGQDEEKCRRGSHNINKGNNKSNRVSEG
jgi:hypothetical protein